MSGGVVGCGGCIVGVVVDGADGVICDVGVVGVCWCCWYLWDLTGVRVIISSNGCSINVFNVGYGDVRDDVVVGIVDGVVRVVICIWCS